MKLSVREIVQATGGVLISGSPSLTIKGISTDTRTLKLGEIFFALKGQNYDGHRFVRQAFEGGAKAAVVSIDEFVVRGTENVLIKVSNTSKALGDLAKYYRGKFSLPMVAVTGSVGKTTTKEMTASILGEKFKVLKTEENFNNEIGIPLTVFKLRSSHQAAVFELAMRGREQIRWLSQIAQPTIGIITNIGLSHLESLGTQRNILRAKAELLEELGREGIAILNREEPFFRELVKFTQGKIISYGQQAEAEVRAEEVEFFDGKKTKFLLKMPSGEVEVVLRAPGFHNLYNALAAAAAGFALGLPEETIKLGLGKFRLPAMRTQVLRMAKGIKIIDDTYNASPASTKAALETLKEIKGVKRRIAVLGDMLELGEASRKAHLKVGKLVAQAEVDFLLTVGEQASSLAEGALRAGLEAQRVRALGTTEEALDKLRELMAPGDIILVKGSRAMHMEEIVRRLLGDRGK